MFYLTVVTNPVDFNLLMIGLGFGHHFMHSSDQTFTKLRNSC